MTILKKSILIIISLYVSLYAQEANHIKDLVSKYKNFEFDKVILLSDSLLKDKENLKNPILAEVIEIKSASLFALGNQNGTRKSFIDLLKIDQNYELSESEYSPKLIALFNEVKSEYNRILDTEPEDPPANSETSKPESASINYSKYQSALAKSLIVPGWGHFEIEENTKGMILTSLGITSLASMIYYIIETGSKESEYLNETNSNLIKQKYNDYNSSFKIRNVLIISYAAIWLYTQIDLLLFNEKNNENIISLSPASNISKYNNQEIFSVSIRL